MSTSAGPGTIMCGPDQSISYFVPPNTLNVNTNTHTESFFNDVFLTSAHHQVAAAEATGIPTLSEWAQIGMVALLVLAGLAALRRRNGRSLAPPPS